FGSGIARKRGVLATSAWALALTAIIGSTLFGGLSSFAEPMLAAHALPEFIVTLPATSAPPLDVEEADKPVSTAGVTPANSAGQSFAGTLTLRSKPDGALVFINRQPVGHTPLRLPRLRAGSHVVWMELAGYQRWTAAVHVPSDRVTRVVAALERDR